MDCGPPFVKEEEGVIMKWTKCIALVGFGVAVASAQATVINFTAAEGYADGNLNNNADWWAYKASATPFTVNSTAGTVTWNPADANHIAVYQNTLSIAEQSFTVAMDFTFAGLGDRTGNIFLPAVKFTTVNNGDGAVGLALWRPNNASNYQMYFVLSTAAQGGTGDHRTNSALFSNTSIGDNGTLDDTTDQLRLELTMNRTAANSWEFLGSLYNLDVDPETTVSTVSGSGLVLSETYNTSNWYPHFRTGSGTGSSPAGTTSFVVDSFSATAIPEPGTLGLLGLAGISLFWLRRRLS